MTRHHRVIVAAVVCSVLACGIAGAQQTSTSSAQSGTPAAQKDLVLLKVQVVITRRQGDKVISRHPYTLTVDADGPRANLRLGAQIPVSSTTGDGKLTSYNYKDVGTVIDCSAKTLDGGRYRLDLALTDNEVLADDASGATKGLPQFGSFSLGNVVAVLKDGQTTQLTTAAEKATGAVIAVDVTMNVVK